MSRYADVTIGRKHMPRVTDRQFNYIIGQYGIDVTLRKRVPVVSNPVPCPCVADDDIFNQINPDCDKCGGTGVLGGEQYRDFTMRAIKQPLNEVGFFGSGILYQEPARFERVWEVCYVKGTEYVDIGDFILDTYTKPTGDEVTVEYEIFDKEAWWLGQGPSRGRRVIFYKLQIRKTEYAKTISGVENY